MAVRKIISRRSWHFRGLFPSIKNGCAVPFESILESGFYRLLELSPMVFSYSVQPLRAAFSVKGVSTKYVPDVRVNLREGSSIIIEIKPSTHLNRQATKNRMSAAEDYFGSVGYPFFTISEEVIWAEPRRTTVEEILYHRRSFAADSSASVVALDLVAKASPRSVEQLCALLDPALAWRLLGLGMVGVDLEKTLSGDSEIFLEGGHRHANFFS